MDVEEWDKRDEEVVCLLKAGEAETQCGCVGGTWTEKGKEGREDEWTWIELEVNE